MATNIKMLSTGTYNTITTPTTLYGPTGSKSALVTAIQLVSSGAVTVTFSVVPAGGSAVVFDKRSMTNGSMVTLPDIWTLGPSGANSDQLQIWLSAAVTVSWTVMGIERD